MSHYIMYRCDGCEFEDQDPSFLLFESLDGERDWCSECEGYADKDRAAGEAARAGDGGE